MKKIDDVLIQVTNEDLLLLKNNSQKFWEGISKIDCRAFSDCSDLKEIIIPYGITEIGNGAFYNCANLKKIKLPDSLTKIGFYAFNGCNSLKEIFLPNSITDIAMYAFSGCTGLIKTKLPESITKIEGSVFENCTSLTEIKLPDSVTEIGKNAFAGCESLKKIKLPDSVTKIGSEAFLGVPKVKLYNKNICGTLINADIFEYIKNNPNVDLKQLNQLYLLAKVHGLRDSDIRELIAFSVNLGILEHATTTIVTSKNIYGEPTKTPVSNVAYTFIQGLIKKGQINLNDLHMDLQAMEIGSYNEEYMKFVVSKTNWSTIKENITWLPTIYEWFMFRKMLDLTQNNDTLLPTEEDNRYKVLVYSTAENGIDRLHWQVPTIENLKKEFATRRFSGVCSKRDTEIAEEIIKHHVYDQKHYDKAKEIDLERESLGVKDILIKKIKENRVKILENYKSKTQALRQQIVSDCAEVLYDQIEDTSSVFTYEVLEKSAIENFAMGLMTSSCACLYGTGGGAMRAMIIHPDMQPLVIRDYDNQIIAFGILYVNREEGYAVVNDFEVNRKYNGQDDNRKAIYENAMKGVVAFVEEYNNEYPEKPITKVTCGISLNWDAINDFIRQNPQSEILKAPNFDDFKYAGSSGSWPGDWHKEQYEIYNLEG